MRGRLNLRNGEVIDGKGLRQQVEKLAEERVPLTRLGVSTLDRPIPEERKRIHAAVIRRLLRERRSSSGS